MLENDGMDTKPLLQVEGLKKYYTAKSGIFSRNIGEIRAVDGVCLLYTSDAADE